MPLERALIRTDHLVKNFGDKSAVRDVSLTVQGGEIFGFLGPNGAGKTTTIKMIVGLLRPTTGWVEVAGHDVQREMRLAKAACGYVPDEPNSTSSFQRVSCCASWPTCTRSIGLKWSIALKSSCGCLTSRKPRMI